MRVFDFYCYNIIDKVKFNKTKAYIDNMLSELGFEYHNVGFLLHCGKVDDTFKKYPVLKKYCRIEDKSRNPQEYGNRYITSLSEKWYEGKIYSDESDIPIVTEIFSKIPRPYNFGFSKLILDGIDWYRNGDISLAIKPNEVWKQIVPPLPDAIGSSGILMEREFDDGNKRNTVWVKIEATTANEPRDTSDIIILLEPYLGKPIHYQRSCYFTQDEYTYNSELAKLFSDEAEKLYSDNVQETPLYYRNNMLNDPMIKDLCGKQTISRIFRKNGIYASFPKTGLPGANILLFRDDHNYLYDILIDRSPSTNSISFRMSIKSYNFTVWISDKSYYLSSKEEATDKIDEIARFVVRLKDSIGCRLSDSFGDCPKWF